MVLVGSRRTRKTRKSDGWFAPERCWTSVWGSLGEHNAVLRINMLHAPIWSPEGPRRLTKCTKPVPCASLESCPQKGLGAPKWSLGGRFFRTTAIREPDRCWNSSGETVRNTLTHSIHSNPTPKNRCPTVSANCSGNFSGEGSGECSRASSEECPEECSGYSF